MTTPVCVQQRIRQLDRQGLGRKEISRKFGVSRTTVVRYANHGDYSPRPSNTARPGRSLVDDGYAAIVDGWPTANPRMPVKQRHTATRVYERLVAGCGFTGSYSSARRWIRRWMREHRAQSDSFAELERTPGRPGLPANPFEAENASRAESKRRRPLGQAGFPGTRRLTATTGAWPRSHPTGGASGWKARNSSNGPRTPCFTATWAAARPTRPSRSACSPANA